jgi:hypothetical protein
MFIMYSYAQDEYFMMKTTPTPDDVDDYDDHYAAPPQILPPKARRRGRQPLLGYGQGRVQLGTRTKPKL